ncbi:hypothetical protein FKP32DRAFT_1591438 [Trametes sanguinea]|nr:hypothetical protein FKP32DRAFT_1591438 [Trametes sanguinea]
MSIVPCFDFSRQLHSSLLVISQCSRQVINFDVRSLPIPRFHGRKRPALHHCYPSHRSDLSTTGESQLSVSFGTLSPPQSPESLNLPNPISGTAVLCCTASGARPICVVDPTRSNRRSRLTTYSLVSRLDSRSQSHSCTRAATSWRTTDGCLRR